jgi:hypothetical protein
MECCPSERCRSWLTKLSGTIWNGQRPTQWAERLVTVQPSPEASGVHEGGSQTVGFFNFLAHPSPPSRKMGNEATFMVDAFRLVTVQPSPEASGVREGGSQTVGVLFFFIQH